jgi:predicted dithiol-disulfide oxidoreductase (DUF899 family)
MAHHRRGTREEWLAARLQLLEAEKELTRRSDELAQRRQELPWVRLEKEYRFEPTGGRLAGGPVPRALTAPRLPLHVRPRLRRRLPVLLSDRGRIQRLRRPPRESRRRIHSGFARAAREAAGVQAADGVDFPWASSFGSDFNFDFNVSVTEEQQRSGIVEYNFRTEDVRPSLEAGKEGPLAEFAAGAGTDWATFTREAPGMSAFALEDGVVYHTYSAYARGLDGLWGMYQWLDRAPLGRNESGIWWRRHDEYDAV